MKELLKSLHFLFLIFFFNNVWIYKSNQRWELKCGDPVHCHVLKFNICYEEYFEKMLMFVPPEQ